MDLYTETKYIMDKFNIVPNKKLGQNFLFDENALEKIAEGVNSDDVVIEIGPRFGNSYKNTFGKS